MTADMAKATITVGDKVITIEGPPEFVAAQVEKFAGINIASGEQVKANKADAPVRSASERDLVESKRPKNHPETVAVLAFSLAEAGQEEFSEEDIKRAYLRANVRPPKVVGQAIRDAKNVYDFIEVGSGRGMYRLTTHGDRTVRFDMPND